MLQQNLYWATPMDFASTLHGFKGSRLLEDMSELDHDGKGDFLHVFGLRPLIGQVSDFDLLDEDGLWFPIGGHLDPSRVEIDFSLRHYFSDTPLALARRDDSSGNAGFQFLLYSPPGYEPTHVSSWFEMRHPDLTKSNAPLRIFIRCQMPERGEFVTLSCWVGNNDAKPLLLQVYFINNTSAWVFFMTRDAPGGLRANAVVPATSTQKRILRYFEDNDDDRVEGALPDEDQKCTEPIPCLGTMMAAIAAMAERHGIQRPLLSLHDVVDILDVAQALVPPGVPLPQSQISISLESPMQQQNANEAEVQGLTSLFGVRTQEPRQLVERPPVVPKKPSAI
jgi:hypothetical protein